ncbi:helix-turn-helix transcriptional regulator [Haloarcula sp. JP-L23]|uniref:helix-turn-helix domain-containing protein n=1 Tax=Haloarcula sp. JP-L23 TaxID=2716717 RepID=UPI00140F31C1|nr:helix-turn-helix domain-containing protein [Haloarcula sp. JP-L23]
MDAGKSDDVAIDGISALGWRLLRVAAGFSQRDVEKEIDDIMQAHISMLESDARSLSEQRLEQLFELYRAELTDEQIDALVRNF